MNIFKKMKINKCLKLIEPKVDKQLMKMGLLTVENSKKNYEDFKKKINDMVLNDDEKILEIAQLFFEDIRVESIKDDETDQKVILHAKLNVSNSKDDTFDFNKFLLLFCSRQGTSCSYKEVINFRKKYKNSKTLNII